jgi:hypothetical protein
MLRGRRGPHGRKASSGLAPRTRDCELSSYLSLSGERLPVTGHICLGVNVPRDAALAMGITQGNARVLQHRVLRRAAELGTGLEA